MRVDDKYIAYDKPKSITELLAIKEFWLTPNKQEYNVATQTTRLHYLTDLQQSNSNYYTDVPGRFSEPRGGFFRLVYLDGYSLEPTLRNKVEGLSRELSTRKVHTPRHKGTYHRLDQIKQILDSRTPGTEEELRERIKVIQRLSTYGDDEQQLIAEVVKMLQGMIQESK